MFFVRSCAPLLLAVLLATPAPFAVACGEAPPSGARSDVASSSRSQASTAAGQTSIPQPAPQARGALVGRIVHVGDGDSVDIEVNGEPVRVRLEGVDAPEMAQPFGPEARNYLRSVAFGRKAQAQSRGVDQYGRQVARVSVDGRDLGETVVAAGFAWHFTRFSSDARLAALEHEARAARRGLWSSPAPVAPWEYRAAARAGEQPSANRGASADVGPWHGNVRSRIYHAPGCPEYDCRSCTAVFATRQAAEAAGYRPHRECVQ